MGTESRKRIFLTGVGGQGTLTATKLLAQLLLDKGLHVTSGEIHGMAQRGGVVESTILYGGWQSPKISHGEADILLGFECLETFRGLPYLAKQGYILSSSEAIPPIAVSRGLAAYPDLDEVRKAAERCSGTARFLPLRSIGRKAGAEQSGNMALLGALCASGMIPASVDDLNAALKSYLKPSIVDVNLKAVSLGVEALGNVQ